MTNSTMKLPQSELLDALNARPKHVFITGASRGIGEAIARRMGENGYNLTLAARSYNRMLGIAMDVGTDKAHAVRLDLEDQQSIDEAIVSAESRFGPIEVLICNAGVNLPTAIDDLSSEGRERFRKVINVNLVGTYFLAQLATQHMPAGGRIVFIGSVLSRFGVGGSHAYTASKHGVLGLVRGMAQELAPRDIRVNAINPVAGETPLLKSFMGKDTPEIRKKFLSTIPIGRFSTPNDIGNTATFLCSDEASMITGVALEVDGGRCI